MERERSKQASLLLWTLLAGLLSQNLLIPVMSTSVEDQKNYYSPDPHTGTPPTGPPQRTPPSHGPRHGGTPHCHCGHHDPPPTTPTYYPPPTTPTYDSPPPTPTYDSPPTTPTTDPPPTTPTGGGYYNSPPTGESTPPSPFFDPGTPTTPGTPFDPNSPPTPPFDPSSPPVGTWNYWSSHPGLIWGLFGYWGSLGGAFGVPSVPGFGPNMSLQQALSNTRTDGFGALYREGTASLLNSMADNRFHFTTKQVRDSFVQAMGSNKAAAAQAHLFKLANEGRLKPRA
uniref:Putative protodermal factor 1 n=1 Tax=Davidia involucrata TaxID=16924 RepID=A0A5B6YL83_DAVIN